MHRHSPPHPPRHPLRSDARHAPWHQRALWAVGAVLLASGAGWLALHYAGTGADGLPHPQEALLMRVHGAAAELGLFVLGAIAAAHVPPGWRLSRRPRWARQRGSGLLLCALALALAASGWALYYAAPEWLRPGLGWAHAGFGLAMALLLTLHRRGAR